jgi:hypothetical protein
MARINLPDHWKFKRLTRAVGSRIVAWGLLEATWWTAYALANDYIGNADDIADACDWPRVARLIGQPEDPKVLVEFLTASGFLDEPEPGRYLVHDLWDHAPAFVKLRWTRDHPTDPPPWNPPPTPTPERTPEDMSTSAVRSQVANTRTYQGRPGKGREEKRERQATAPRSRSLHLVEAATPNPRVLAKVAHDLHGHEPFATLTDLKEALKDLAVRYRLLWDGDSLTRALEILDRSRRPVLVASLPRREARRRRA